MAASTLLERYEPLVKSHKMDCLDQHPRGSSWATKLPEKDVPSAYGRSRQPVYGQPGREKYRSRRALNFFFRWRNGLLLAFLSRSRFSCVVLALAQELFVEGGQVKLLARASERGAMRNEEMTSRRVIREAEQSLTESTQSGAGDEQG